MRLIIIILAFSSLHAQAFDFSCSTPDDLILCTYTTVETTVVLDTPHMTTKGEWVGTAPSDEKTVVQTRTVTTTYTSETATKTTYIASDASCDDKPSTTAEPYLSEDVVLVTTETQTIDNPNYVHVVSISSTVLYFGEDGSSNQCNSCVLGKTGVNAVRFEVGSGTLTVDYSLHLSASEIGTLVQGSYYLYEDNSEYSVLLKIKADRAQLLVSINANDGYGDENSGDFHAVVDLSKYRQ